MIPGKPIFISHSSKDDAFVARLRKALELRDIPAWVDSLQMRGSDSLWPKIAEAIADAGSVMIVLSRESINSGWVIRELDEAQKVKKKIGKDEYRVIPLMLPGIESELVKRIFGEGILGIPIHDTAPDGLQVAMPQLLAALGIAAPNDPEHPRSVDETPIAELTLLLSNPATRHEGGRSITSARAKLEFRPARDSRVREMEIPEFKFHSPWGPIEADDLRWYIEQYLIWPSGLFAERGKRIEGNLAVWGKQLFDAVFEGGREKILTRWQSSAKDKTELRFSVRISQVFDKETETDKAAASAFLLSIPWELLNHGKGFLFQGLEPVRVRRQLPNHDGIDIRPPSSPLRILLVSPRPEGPKGEYWLDPRVSALPLVEAIEGLGAYATLTSLQHPNFKDFIEELERAANAGKPYDVVHFDGHGIYDKKLGLGALCFESHEDRLKRQHRALDLVHADKLGAELQKHNIPLIFLEACQTAQQEADVQASVATRLLQEGVASVVSMSHSVLVVTASKFVKAFYKSLADGARIGAAMLAGQQTLARDTYRLTMPGVGKIHLHDWFVPVLYQDREDPILLRKLPTERGEEDIRKTRQRAFGHLPKAPTHHFHGRDRELLYLERLLQTEKYAVIRGVGGMGKTTLASELARWLVRTGRFSRAAFLSVENFVDIHGLLHDLGAQLTAGLSANGLTDDAQAMKEIFRALQDFPTIIVLDNLESVLPAPGQPVDAHMSALQQLFTQLLDASQHTRLLFTSREAMPAPFASFGVELGALGKRQAVNLVRTIMEQRGIALPDSDTGNPHADVQNFVETVGGHPRALVLLAPFLREGIADMDDEVAAIMQKLEKAYPGERERSLFASVELSLRRLTEEQRQQIRPLAVFYGGFHYVVLGMILGIEGEEAMRLSAALVQTGLAEEMTYGYFRMDPALAAYLGLEMGEEERVANRGAWMEGMEGLMGLIYEQIFKDTNLASSLGQMEIPNLMATLEEMARKGTAERIIAYSTNLEQLLQNLGKRELVRRVAEIHEKVSSGMEAWNHAAFLSRKHSIERRMEEGKQQEAYQAAMALKARCLDAGEDAYPGAPYNLAVSSFLLGRISRFVGQNESALREIALAKQRFEALAKAGYKEGERMASICLAEEADCNSNLGKYDEAIPLYNQAIVHAEKREDRRSAAALKSQLGTVYMFQKEYAKSIQALQAAKDTFEQLNEPRSVAIIWHQLGIVYQKIPDFEQADRHYKESLKIETALGNRAGEASTLIQLGNLYDKWKKYDEAVVFYSQSADAYAALNNDGKEGKGRNNLADTLIKIGRLKEARIQLNRAIECKKSLGLEAEPWKTYDILCDLEKAEGNTAAAAVARREAIRLFGMWRRSGAENHSRDAKLCAMAFAAIQGREILELESYLKTEIAQDLDYKFDIHLLGILQGSRDPQTLQDEGLNYQQVVELELLLEGL